MSEGKPGQKPLGKRPLTPAERQARSRAKRFGGCLGHLQVADELCKVLRYEIDRPELLDRLEDLELHIALARQALGA